MKNIFRENLLTLIYYGIVYLFISLAFKAYPANGGPSEAVFLLFGITLLSFFIFLYSLTKFLKGDNRKVGSIIIHLVACYIALKTIL